MNQLNNNNGINQISPSKLKRKTVKIVEESNQNIKKKSEDGSSP